MDAGNPATVAARPVADGDASGVPLHRSVRARVAAWGLLINTALVVVVAAASFFIAQRIIVGNAESRTRALAQQQAERIAATLKSVTVGTRVVERLVRAAGTDRARVIEGLRSVVDSDPDASGGLVALEPGVLGAGGFAYYVGQGGHDQDLAAAGFPYREQAFYRRARDADRGWWSEPYFSKTRGQRWLVTYNQPLRSEDGRRLGMTSLDVPVSHITGLMAAVLNREGLRAVLIAPAGTIVVHPVPGVALHTRVDQLIARGRKDLRPLAEARARGEPLEYSHVDPNLDERRFTVFAPIDDSGWSMSLALSQRVVLANLYSASRLLLVGALLAVLVSVLAQMHLARRVTGPLNRLAESARRFSAGAYDQAVPHLRRVDEVGVLARALDGARVSIKGQLEEIERMGAARQKLESELDIARDIQQAMLPVAPTLTHRGRVLQVYAALEPAKAVGGDFYTFSVRRGRWLWFAIGDVSDKGVPAALFMARAMTVLEVAAGLGGSPGAALGTAAGRLVEGNDTCMFATVLCGLLDVETGELQLASAGHEPAVLVHPDGGVELLEVESGGALGVDAAETYPVWQGTIRAGDTLLAYTDGVTEAFNAAGEAFGMQGLVESLLPGGDPQRTCLALLHAVHRFCVGAPQSDDITVLALCLRAQGSEEA